ncbi:U32 family peptidase [Rhodovulum sulfidophilum]|uniref:Ubiquinone biosynthesis protein UbiU n=1 Tax=Rhodovulum sulfidophilum TaxID=35806 RepID=A0A0D6AZK5_RHOSU|nr:peptidase U32 family protein [Rhodovulum sulfidophilum]ANB35644.1 protease [Rhodovulum sulfidophilum DSM 1374]ANB39466.1 protease [Rhodovulum sulfidophilum]MBL3550918.1 U32 family peptidase [Rhodovulum sulfidophilum]MBL3562004.1 U32 family peptidase [Rhodovulum sulfidophilum]MBL3564343.1 U32 family peptidase [Rhodovulum sulfidophilum]
MIKPELICPAGTPAALRSAVDAGADAVYCGYQNATNARNFVGLNFTPEEMEKSIKYAHDGGTKVLITLNTFPPAGNVQLWKDAADLSAKLGADACIVADIAVAAYIQKTHPQMRIHLSVQAAASSPEAIRYYVQEFGVKRIVLPRIMTVSEIKGLVQEIPCEVETFIFGNHGLMVEGRCSLTNYVTGQSTNMDGACSPASCVKYERAEDGSMSTILGDYMIDRFKPDETAGYPTICKGRYKCDARDDGYYAFEEPVSLNASTMLPDLINAGVHAFKIEGRQRSRAYVKKVVAAFREAVDSIMAGQEPKLADLVALTEGQKHTEGALKTKKWR